MLRIKYSGGHGCPMGFRKSERDYRVTLEKFGPALKELVELCGGDRGVMRRNCRKALRLVRAESRG